MAISGTVTSDLSSGIFGFELDFTFVACADGGTVLDGVLAYEGSASQAAVTVSMSGEITFSGQLSATCEIDISSEINVDSDQVGLSGTICGHDVSLTVS